MKIKPIYMSIKPIHINRIINGIKNYEFRNYIPKELFNTIFVYVSYPVCMLSYIIYISNIIEYPNKITKEGFGNDEFNSGVKTTKYAYEISEIYKLNKPISLKDLKEKYDFSPPQAFAYGKKYMKLTSYILNAKKGKI